MALEESGEFLNKSSTKKKSPKRKYDIIINERKNTKNVQDKNKSNKEVNRVPEFKPTEKDCV